MKMVKLKKKDTLMIRCKKSEYVVKTTVLKTEEIKKKKNNGHKPKLLKKQKYVQKFFYGFRRTTACRKSEK